MVAVIIVDYILCNLEDPFGTMTTDLELLNCLDAFNIWHFQNLVLLWVNIVL